MNSKMSDRKLWVERTGYGLGNIGVALIGALITTYLTMYMTNVALLDVAAVSLIMAVSRVFDGISDIVIGNIIDNTRSRFGKARAWLLRMSLPYAVSMFLLFYVPPQWPGAVRYVYVFITYNLVNTVIRTFIQISNYSMVPLMTEDPMEQGLLGNIQHLRQTSRKVYGRSRQPEYSAGVFRCCDRDRSGVHRSDRDHGRMHQGERKLRVIKR